MLADIRFTLSDLAELLAYLKAGEGFGISAERLNRLFPEKAGDNPRLWERCRAWARAHGCSVRSWGDNGMEFVRHTRRRDWQGALSDPQFFDADPEKVPQAVFGSTGTPNATFPHSPS